MLYNIGPRTDPLGTLYVTRLGDERVERTKTEEVMLVINENSHLCAVPLIPIDVKWCMRSAINYNLIISTLF